VFDDTLLHGTGIECGTSQTVFGNGFHRGYGVISLRGDTGVYQDDLLPAIDKPFFSLWNQCSVFLSEYLEIDRI